MDKKYLDPVPRPDDHTKETTPYDRKKWYLDWLVLWPSDWDDSKSPDLTHTIAEDLAEFAGGYGPYWETMDPKTINSLNAHTGHPITLKLNDLLSEYYEKRSELIKRMDGDKNRALKEVQQQYLDMFGQKPPEKRLGVVPTVHQIIHDEDWSVD
ncbi:MAG: hypothetical protein OXE92_10760 [Bacteroidetes bacterium]|nr:hypothetical protein [Bacteroidota bacterium]MCY4206191.1 hypothetical protein [Bacteroidota bacterium]